MKKLLFVPAALLGIFFISCNNNAAGPSATTQKNLDAMHGVQQAFDKKDFSKVGDYIAEDAVDHAGEQGDIKGLANIKAQFEKWAAGSENDKSVTTKEMADDDYVMSWAKYSGTSKTASMGVKPGEHFEMEAVEVCKFKDGKITDHWSFVNPKNMMKMMGNMQQPMPMPADSTRKDTAKKM